MSILSDLERKTISSSSMRDPENLEQLITEIKVDASFFFREKGAIRQRVIAISDKSTISLDIDENAVKENRLNKVLQRTLKNISVIRPFCVITICEMSIRPYGQPDSANVRTAMIAVNHHELGNRSILGHLKHDRKGRPKKIVFEQPGEEKLTVLKPKVDGNKLQFFGY